MANGSNIFFQMLLVYLIWRALMTGVVGTVDRIALNGACSAGESCLSDNAECLQGRCQCRPGFFSVNHDCGNVPINFLF